MTSYRLSDHSRSDHSVGPSQQGRPAAEGTPFETDRVHPGAGHDGDGAGGFAGTATCSQAGRRYVSAMIGDGRVKELGLLVSVGVIMLTVDEVSTTPTTGDLVQSM